MAEHLPEQEPPVKVTALGLNGLFVLSLFYTAYFARSVLLPFTLALFFAFLLRPVVRLLKRIRVPELAAAAVVLLSFLAITGYGISNLSGPALDWVEKAPDSLRQIGQKLEGILSPVQKAGRTAEELKKLTRPEKENTRVTVLPGPGLAETIVSGMREFLAQGTIMLILLFFMLATGDLFVVKLMDLYPSAEKKAQVAETVREVEHSISRYLLTVTLINFFEGIVVALGMFLIGMPDAALWGVMAALLIYIPYLGPLVGISIVTVVALFTLEFRMALLAPAIYLFVEILQGQFLTPLILGVRFRMNPLVIFLWLVLWAAIWGVIGAIIAVPLLTIFKILCERIVPLKPIARFLSDR